MHDWMFHRPTWTQRVQMRWAEVDWLAWQIVRWVALVCAAFVVYSAGFVSGERSVEGCNVDRGQQAIGVFAFRDENGVLRCQVKSNPYYAPRGK